jgi:hypothetical protein
MRAAVLRRTQQEQQNHCETGKELNPEVEPQIIDKAPGSCGVCGSRSNPASEVTTRPKKN